MSMEDGARRRALKAAAGCAAWAFAAAVHAQSAPKLSQAEVKYVERGREGMDCDDCRHFVPGQQRGAAGSCRIVAGAISPHGYCVAFAEKRS